MTPNTIAASPLEAVAALNTAGEFAQAFALCRKLFAHHKNDTTFLLQMAISALGVNNLAQAQTLAHKILKLDCESGAAHNVLGVVAMKKQDLHGAVHHLSAYAARMPHVSEAHLNLAEALSRTNQGALALQHLHQACTLSPQDPRAHYLCGVCLLSLGRPEEAAGEMRTALALKPHYAGAWKVLADLNQLDAETDAPQLQETLRHLDGQPEEQAKLHFALARLHETAKSYDIAFDHYVHGNTLIRDRLNYDVASDEQNMRDTAQVFSADWLDAHREQGHTSARMIFIVGMPRSGTTLVEQILAGHAHVYAGGERSFFANALETHSTVGQSPYPHSARRWTQKHLRRIAESYLHATDALDRTAPHVTDKMPSNFLHLGAIHAVFPKARIIHCTRNPIDTCLGNFRQLFTVGQAFSYDQDDLARYYTAYRGLMDHWRALLGDAILDVSYERLTQNPEEEARKIVAHCHLDWQDGCLDVQDTERAIYTASAAQVRTGIHDKYQGRWRQYEGRISPAILALA